MNPEALTVIVGNPPFMGAKFMGAVQRAEGATLADLYDPLTMPPELLKAHRTLDRAVDAAYGKSTFATEAERVAFLFEWYQAFTSLLPEERAKPVRTRKLRS